MLAAFFGDTHGNLNSMYDYALAWQERTGLTLDLVVQVGDFGFWLTDEAVDKMSAKHVTKRNESAIAEGKEEIPVCGDYQSYVLGDRVASIRTLVIRGNHEDQEYLMTKEKQHQALNPEDYLTKTISMVPNISYLPDGHVVEIDGVKFGGLGGNFSYKTFHNWDYWDQARHKKVRYEEKRRLNHFTKDRYELLARSEMDVLLLHDAPSNMDLRGSSTASLPADEVTQDLYGSCGCPLLTELIEAIKPKYTFCGHWHQRRDRSFGPNMKVTVLNLTSEEPTADCMEIVEL